MVIRLGTSQGTPESPPSTVNLLLIPQSVREATAALTVFAHNYLRINDTDE